MTTASHKRLPSGQLWSGTSIPDFPTPGTRVFWDLGTDKVPATVIAGHVDYENYRHCLLKLDRAATFWNCDQWHGCADDIADLLPKVDAAGAELAPIDRAHLVPRQECIDVLPAKKQPYFGFLYACLEARRICGRSWKKAVRQAWYDGNYRREGLKDYSQLLQRLRNQPNLAWFHLDFALPFAERDWWAKRS